MEKSFKSEVSDDTPNSKGNKSIGMRNRREEAKKPTTFGQKASTAEAKKEE